MNSVSALKYQTLLDLVVQTTGTMENAFALAQANNMSVTGIIESGSEMMIPSDITRDNAVVKYLSARGIKPASGDSGTTPPVNWGAYWVLGTSELASHNVATMKDQTLFDMAIQMTGSLENVFELAKANGISTTHALEAGTDITPSSAAAANPKVVNYLSARGIKPASMAAARSSASLLEGIDYWIIETDFIVS